MLQPLILIENATMNKSQLLLVDDDRHVLESMADWLRDQGYELDASSSYADALERLRRKSFDLVLADIRLRDGDGFDLLEQCRRNWPASQVILMTGYGTPDGAIEAIRAGAFDYLTKPLIDDELLMAIERAISQRSVHGRKQEPPGPARPPLRHGQHRRPRPADAEGVRHDRQRGRHAGHGAGHRRKRHGQVHDRPGHPPPQRPRERPFVEVACGALPETLLESELFGHVAGAFTGATGEKMGKFLQADGGTIFLDEIGTASPAMQVKLLRVLQELKFEPVGGTKTFDVDVRVILATNEDLAQGRGRRPLPPGPVLPRQRDQHRAAAAADARRATSRCWPTRFLEQVCEDSRRKVTGFADDAMAALERYHWPGNVRELQNVVERAVLLGKGPMITRGRPADGSPRLGERVRQLAGRPADAQGSAGRARAADHSAKCSSRTTGTATPRPTSSASTARRSTRR